MLPPFVNSDPGDETDSEWRRSSRLL